MRFNFPLTDPSEDILNYTDTRHDYEKLRDILCVWHQLIPEQLLNLYNGIDQAGIGWSSDTIGEYGTITNLNHDWQTITLNQNYINPVVIVSDPTFNGTDPATVRLDNVTENSFELRIQEVNYLDDIHTVETVSYLVVEAGDWELSDGT